MIEAQNNNSVKDQDGNSSKPMLAAVLSSADLFENVECNINGEIKLMNEYRILVEPNSKVEKELYLLLYGS